MTKYEELKSMELEDIGHELCALMEKSPLFDSEGCSICPCYEICHADRLQPSNGFTEWLKGGI